MGGRWLVEQGVGGSVHECKWVHAQQDRLKPYLKAGKIAVGSTDYPYRLPHSQRTGYFKGPTHIPGHEYLDTVLVSKPIARGPCPDPIPKPSRARGGLLYHIFS